MSSYSVEPQRLPNGLHWLARPVPGALASVRVVYRVGARDDPTGRSGMTHLALRLTAGASRYLEPGQFHRLIAQAGGTTTLEIDDDFAALQSTVLAPHLERLLWAEAERMSNPRLDPDTLVRGRAQLRQAAQQPLLQPYGRLDLAVQRHGYLTHPYQRGTLGDPDQLRDLDVEELRAFHAANFRTDRALLVITGAFDEGALARWVMHYFGSIRSPMGAAGSASAAVGSSAMASSSSSGNASAVPAPSPKAELAGSAASPGMSSSAASAAASSTPSGSAGSAASSNASGEGREPREPREARDARRPQSQTLKLSLPQAPLPAAALVWQVPRLDDASSPAWRLAHALLGRGRSGRLTDTLVDELAVAHHLNLRLVQHQQAGLLVAQALAAHGQTAAPLAAALLKEVLRLADEPVSDEELDKAKALLKREWQAGEWGASTLAKTLADAWVLRGDVSAPAKDAALWARLTADDVQQLWRRQVVQAPVLTLLADVGAAAAAGAGAAIVRTVPGAWA
ncbi:M16 family metallopeptidase [Roseateles amylovorans]|uniref:Insulinase family protein n=1 Tax=Roseateles amylovorans TaxID=2978473 RepID=A0ABY6B417_9BURK|nr:insulinase family protein [Roseateles amylovorans]UXH78709.1 insulinase family protein [Roseateles amylovorans]